MLLALTTGVANAQPGGVIKMQGSPNFSNSAFTRENIFVHTDKNFYVTGEVIWFKVYCLDADSGKPSTISNVVYVEVLSAAHKPALQAKVVLKEGIGYGSLVVSATVLSGNYVLRAYTNWMKNDDPSLYFEKTVTLVNPQKPPIRDPNTVMPGQIAAPVPAIQPTFHIVARSNQAHYGTRTKVDVDISTDPASMANLSLSVYKIDSLERATPDDITSYRASTSRDTIKSPFKYVPEYAGHFVTGVITDKRSGTPAPGVNASLSFPGNPFLFTTSTSNRNGQVTFAVSNFFGAGELIVEAPGPYRIDLLSPFSESYSATALPPLELPEEWQEQLVSRITNAQIQTAFSDATRQAFVLPTSDSTPFYGTPDKSYNLDDYTRFVTMEEVMREYVAEVLVRKSGNNFHFRVLNIPYKVYFDNDPLVLIDGVLVSDINKIMAFDPLKIKKIDIVARKYYLGGTAYNGVISYSTYHGDLAGYQLDPEALVVEYQGLQLHRQFNTPMYETAQDRESRLPDLRNVLLWSPDINMDAHGHAQLAFYTSDLPGKYVGVINGITKNGAVGSTTFTFIVEK